jgi:hypothetical protein
VEGLGPVTSTVMYIHLPLFAPVYSSQAIHTILDSTCHHPLLPKANSIKKPNNNKKPLNNKHKKKTTKETLTDCVTLGKSLPY